MAVVLRSLIALILTTTDNRLQYAICTYLLNASLRLPCVHRICMPCARKQKPDKYRLKFTQCYTLWPAGNRLTLCYTGFEQTISFSDVSVIEFLVSVYVVVSCLSSLIHRRSSRSGRPATAGPIIW